MFHGLGGFHIFAYRPWAAAAHCSAENGQTRRRRAESAFLTPPRLLATTSAAAFSELFSSVPIFDEVSAIAAVGGTVYVLWIEFFAVHHLAELPLGQSRRGVRSFQVLRA